MYIYAHTNTHANMFIYLSIYLSIYLFSIYLSIYYIHECAGLTLESSQLRLFTLKNPTFLSNEKNRSCAASRVQHTYL